MKLIIKLDFENNSYKYKFENSIEEFTKIILFTQAYKDDIKNILIIFSDIAKYFPYIEDKIYGILEQDIIKYETFQKI